MKIKYKKLRANGEKIIGYRVGADGSIWSKRLKNCQVTIGEVWRELKPIKKNTGHMMITLFIDGKQKCFYIHRLVLEAFVGPCPKGMECCHNDDNPKNNKLDNLRWGTRKDNMHDRIKYDNVNRGEKCPTSKLKTHQVFEIRERSASGEKAEIIANDYPVSPATVRDIAARRRWAHL